MARLMSTSNACCNMIEFVKFRVQVVAVHLPLLLIELPTDDDQRALIIIGDSLSPFQRT